jgi:hypothetical protein
MRPLVRNKHGHDRLCWLSQKRAEKRSYIQHLKAREIEHSSVTLTLMTLEIDHRDLPNRVKASFTLMGNSADSGYAQDLC